MASALDYYNPAYLIHMFKKVTGISPLQFRHEYHK
ncbi:AraC family transcriptional regulator [Sphingobacterium faecium]